MTLTTVLFSGLLAALAGMLWAYHRKHRQASALKSEVCKLNDALNHVPSYIYIKNREHKYTYGNRATLDLFGVSKEEITNATDQQFFPPETVERLFEIDSGVFSSGQASHEEIVSGTDPRTQTVYWEVKHPLRNTFGEIIGLVGISTDVTEIYRLRQELETRASTDGLTLVNNRSSFFEIADIEFSRSRRYRSPMTFMVLDLDHFKRVNDRYGHPVGDKVLQLFADLCRRTIRVCDIIGRIGGEEFAVLLPTTTVSEAQVVAERIHHENKGYCISGDSGERIKATVSIGLTCLLDTDKAVGDIYARADAALYQAKANGRNQTVTLLYESADQDCSKHQRA